MSAKLSSISFAEYAAIDAVNWSWLKSMRQSALHFQYHGEHSREDSVMFAKGRAFHTAVLEPDRLALDYAVFTGARRAGKAWDDFEVANANKTILKAEEFGKCLEMARAVKAHPAAARYLASGKAEQTIEWVDAATGIKCKARPDWLCSAVVDLKSSREVGQAAFGKTAARLDYHGQLAFYRRGVVALTGKELPLVFIAVEHEAPHDVCVYRVPESVADEADTMVSDLLFRVKQCRATGQWPGAHPDEEDLLLPPWALVGDGDEELTSEVLDEEEGEQAYGGL